MWCALPSPFSLPVGVVVTAAISALKRAASFITSTDDNTSSTSHGNEIEAEVPHRAVDKVVVLGGHDDDDDGGGGYAEDVFESRSIIRRTILPLARSLSRRFSLPFGRLVDST